MSTVKPTAEAGGDDLDTRIPILAVLARHPRSGYELATAMSRPLGHFWTARHSQIHPELQRLVAARQVSFEQVPGAGTAGQEELTPSTDEGLAALRQWVVDTADRSAPDARRDGRLKPTPPGSPIPPN